MLSAFIILILLIECFLYLYLKRRSVFQYFSKLGIPYPKPHWLLGNLLEFHGKRISICLSEISRTFESIWVFFEGPNPVLILPDVKSVQTFYVNNSEKFLARKLLPIDLEADSSGKPPRNIFQSEGQTWKMLRSSSEPAFTDSKLSAMEDVIDHHVDIFMKRLPINTEVDIYPEVMRFGLYLNCECFFGISLNASDSSSSFNIKGEAKEKLHPIHEGVQNFFLDMEKLAKAHGVWALAIIFPELHTLLRPFCNRLVNSDAVKYLKKQMALVIKDRLSSNVSTKSKRQDLLQNLIHHSGLSSQSSLDNVSSSSSSLNHRDLIEQVQVLMYAGHETTPTALAYVMYCLARHPAIQNELRQSLSHLPLHPTNHELKQVPLLSNVILEALRLFPVVSSLSLARRCTTSHPVEVDGITIPPGVYIAPDVHKIHRDPRHWGPLPDAFNPKRPQLSIRNNPAWLAFGVGPRRCMGRRFAITTLQRTIHQLLRSFQLESDALDLELVEAFNILPKNVPIQFKLLNADEK